MEHINGKFGKAFQLNGKGVNVVEVPSVVKLAGMKASTIATWVKPNGIKGPTGMSIIFPKPSWGAYRLLKSPYTRSGVDDGVAAHLRGRVRALAYGCQRAVLQTTRHDIRDHRLGHRSYLPLSEHHWRLLRSSNGLLVLAGNQSTSINDSNAFVGHPQANCDS